MQTMTVRRSHRSFLAYAALCLVPLLAVACGGDEDGDSPETAAGGDGGTSSVGGASSTTMGGEGGTSSTVGGGTNAAQTDNVLVDDFEDGNGTSALETDWYSYADTNDGGASVLTISKNDDGALVMDGEGYSGSAHSLKLGVTFDQGDYKWEPYVGVGTTLPSRFDASQYQAIQYTYRGSAHAVQLQTSDVTDYDYFAYYVPASSNYTTVTLAYSSFVQAGFGKTVKFDASHITGVVWQLRGSTGQTANLEMDNVYFSKNKPAESPDWVIHEAESPARQTLTDVTVNNELQRIAAQYLNRGYNITNWLEEGKFTGFTYDEDFVEHLAAAGFQGLRLPIDLDLYITKRDQSSGSLVLTIDDSLWTLLDAFVEWTEKYGLSLTIDYHGYDGSFSLTDESKIADVASLWTAVANRYASNTREDLFYEILNETEQLTGASDAISSSALTPVAKRMIAAIRAEDANHPIIFGDTSWYSLDNLSARTPFPETDRVIYAFHFYEPYIFTHQGADWAKMATTHDVPYPYDPARWSEYSSKLGFNASMPSWILSLTQSYYQMGNAATLYNRLAKVKKWAVKNDVPVICNEFGAYDATSRLEDRERYYSDLVGAFDELEIPWQLWFMILDANTGEVDSAYSKALGL